MGKFCPELEKIESSVNVTYNNILLISKHKKLKT